MTPSNPHDILHRHFGFSDFRPGQRQVIDTLLCGQSALAVFPTGAGKSLCYQLPALSFEGLTLVVSPLIALMKDQIDFLRSRSIPAERLDSSLSAEENRRIVDQMESGDLKLLYVAPERFNNERFLRQLSRTRISLFAVDEAHCISEWGHNFRPDYLKLAEAARAVNAERVLALTATATPTVVRDICSAFHIAPADAVVTGFYRPNLNFCLTPTRTADRDALLLKRIQSRRPGPTIIYVTLQKTAQRVANDLEAAGFPARAYHAGMTAEDRTSIQDWWMASDAGIVVATIAFGMGIDRSNVRYVYHYNLPKSLESYSQEIGRAGRDGLKSTVELLACPDDVPALENFAYGDTPTQEALTSLLTHLLSLGDKFDVNLFQLSSQFDIRQLVLRTALTYLELMDILRQGTPFYAAYEVALRSPLPQLFAQPEGPVLKRIFAVAKTGVKWRTINPDDAASATGDSREQIVEALEALASRGMLELRVADVRQRYRQLQEKPDPRQLAATLFDRFQQREDAEIRRLQQVLELVSLETCQVNALVKYFGEYRTEPCGHCTVCVRGPASLPAPAPPPPMPTGTALSETRQVRGDYPEVLGHPRQLARFLCGLSSPALTREKLTRQSLFGSLEDRRFHEVLDFCRTFDE